MRPSQLLVLEREVDGLVRDAVEGRAVSGDDDVGAGVGQHAPIGQGAAESVTNRAGAVRLVSPRQRVRR